MANTPLSIPERFQPALDALLTSCDYAVDSGLDAWQFAIGLPELLANGAMLADLRWLIHRGFAEHAKETTNSGDPTRSFIPLARTSFPNDACVVLTTAGATALRALHCVKTAIVAAPSKAPVAAARLAGKEPDAAERRVASSSRSTKNRKPGGRSDNKEPGGRGRRRAARGARLQPPATAVPLVPHYDVMLHELRLGHKIVKRFTRPAPAQELILAVLQEEGWPPAIDDPLTSEFNQDPKRHLHYTIRNLNRGQTPLRIRFYINGHGETIRWEILPHQRALSARSARQRR